MATPEKFKALHDAVPAEVQGELYKLMTAYPDASCKRMMEIAAEKGMTLTVKEVKGFLKQMDEEDEFDDFEHHQKFTRKTLSFHQLSTRASPGGLSSSSQ